MQLRAHCLYAFLLLPLVVTIRPQPFAQQPTAEPAQLPSGAEAISIYRTFLLTWNEGSKTTLNVSATTDAFAPNDSDLTGCLRGFPRVQKATTHVLPPDAFFGLNVKLVDPTLHQKRDPGDAIRHGEPVDQAVEARFAAGIFTFSEIVFNPHHTRAAFTYSFVCGSLCGNGGTVILHRTTKGRWSKEKSRCSSWIS